MGGILIIKILFGLILLLAPFLLVTKFKDKKLAFAYILSFIIAFQFIVALITQALHIFTYSVIIAINFLAFILIVIRSDFKEIITIFKKKTKEIDWILILVIVTLFIQLYSIHYNFTGTITTAVYPFYEDVENMKYVYPYFVDEWYSIAFIEKSIESRSLPLKNPLVRSYFLESLGKPDDFVNLELPFHSLISEIILLLNLDPLTQFTIIAIITGILVCLLIYFLLRFNNVGKLPAAIACLSVPYIVVSGNLPGIWNLLPVILGIILTLLGFFFVSERNIKMIIFMSFLIVIFYPPLIIFYVLASFSSLFFSEFFSKKRLLKLFLAYFGMFVIILSIMFLLALLARPQVGEASSYLMSKIYHNILIPNSIPQFLIYNIIPIPILILSVFGFLIKLKEKAWLIAPIVLGLIYWGVYTFSTSVFVIEYSRIVLITSIILTILSGFGLHYLIILINNVPIIKRFNVLNYLQILMIIILFLMSFSYTERDNWKELKLVTKKSGTTFLPASPANIYLHPDDLRLFSGLKNKTFLGVPWKGTVLGIATDNFPINIKAGTLARNTNLSNRFIDFDCQGKYRVVNDIKRKISADVDYIYAPAFECPGFELEGVSAEGLHLYEVNYRVTEGIVNE